MFYYFLLVQYMRALIYYTLFTVLVEADDFDLDGVASCSKGPDNELTALSKLV